MQLSKLQQVVDRDRQINHRPFRFSLVAFSVKLALGRL